MRKFLGVCLLVLLLTELAGAGIMPNGSSEPPPPPPTASAEQEPATAATTEDGTQGTFQDAVTQVVLTILVSVLP